MSRNLCSPDNLDDFPVAEEATEQAFEELQENPDPSRYSCQLSSDSLGFAEFMDSLDLPPGVMNLTEDTPQSPTLRETVKNIRYLVAELYSGEKDLRKIQHEKEALFRLAMPPPPASPLIGYPFVLKVFMAAGSIGISGLNWSEDGLELEVNYLELQDHLTSGRSVFRYPSMLQFTDQLLSHGFTRIFKEELEPADTCHPILLHFEHPDFAKGSLGGLQKLLEESRLLDPGKNADEQAGEAEEDGDEDGDEEEAGDVEKAKKLPQFRVPLHLPAPGHLSRMRLRGDRCCLASSKTRSSLQVARCRFRTLLDHLATVNVLAASRHLTSNSLKKSRPWEYPPFVSSSVRFVKPHDSVILLDVDKPPDYAGYYGEVDAAKVTKFFADYLPRYGHKLTGYKDIVLETSHKPSNFQQNLPIGLAYSDGEDIDHDDVQPPVSPGDLDSDMDSKPSTSAAAAAAALRSSSGRKRAAESVDDQDLEEAMQELCGGSTVLKENVPLSRGRPKAQQPKTPKATPRKRPPKGLESSSSETEAPVSQKGKRAKKDTVQVSRKSKTIQLETVDENKDPLLEEGPSSSRGKAKDQQSKTPKSKPRKPLTSSSEDEATASLKEKKVKKEGVQASRKRKSIPLKNMDGENEEETLLKKAPKQKRKPLQDAEQDEAAEEDEVEEAAEPESAEEEEDLEEEENVEKDEELQENEDAEELEELEDDEDPEEDEDEEADENEEDDDDDDYNVQYRAAPQEPEKPRRYDLRNSKRQPH